ncbi:MAG: hypothetical protein IBX56_05330 [Methylomicrobium sp.]|nr:hypothetical protein [Methylomicrobium sp.]
MINHDKFRTLVKQLYATVNELEAMFPGRHFTPDGHMVGSLGECLVADAYNLELKTASSVAFRSQPQHTIIIKILRDGTFEEIYNGPGALVWDQFTGKRLPSNGQFQISLNKLRQLNQTVAQSDRVPRAI